MIKTNLSVLLAERGLKAKKVSRDTGISQTTLTSLVNNTGKGIQFDTIDTLCRYFGISPDDFFDFYPISIEVEMSTNQYSLDWVANEYYEFEKVTKLNFEFDYFMDIEYKNRKHSFSFTGNVVHSATIKDKNICHIKLLFDNAEEKPLFNEVFEDIPVSFHSIVERTIETEIVNNFYKEHDDWIKDEGVFSLIPDSVEGGLNDYVKSTSLVIDFENIETWLFRNQAW